MVRRRMGYVVMALCAFTTMEKSYSDTLETYGDSVTAGFISYTSLVQPLGWVAMTRLRGQMAAARLSHRADITAALHAPTLAWPAVLAQQLFGNKNYQLHNQAVSGARTSHLFGQVDGAPEPDGAVSSVFFIGHNDLCGRQDSVEAYGELFEAQMRQALKRWDARHGEAQGFLIPIADIHRVYAVLSAEDAPAVEGAAPPFSCYNAWERLFPYCPQYARQQREGTLEAYMKPRIEEANRRLIKISDAWTSDRKNTVRALMDVQNGEYRREYFATDCFHLSAEGQKTIAERIFRAMR